MGKRIRGDQRPFGGIQLILCGDFFQLPPIAEHRNGSSDYCFDCEAWDEVFGSDHGRPPLGRMMTLGKVFRQRDSTFLEILQEMRSGVISARTSSILTQKQREYAMSRNKPMEAKALAESSGAITPRNIILYSRNDLVDAENKRELAQLPGERVLFKAIDNGSQAYLDQLKKGLKAPEILELCVGAQVMLLTNLSTAIGLVNGARGVIVEFQPTLPEYVKFSPLLPLVEFTVNLAGVESTVKRLIEPHTFENGSNDR